MAMQSFVMLIDPTLLEQRHIAGPTDAIFPEEKPILQAVWHNIAIYSHIQLPTSTNNMHMHYRAIGCFLRGNNSVWSEAAGAAKDLRKQQLFLCNVFCFLIILLFSLRYYSKWLGSTL